MIEENRSRLIGTSPSISSLAVPPLSMIEGLAVLPLSLSAFGTSEDSNLTSFNTILEDCSYLVTCCISQVHVPPLPLALSELQEGIS